MTNPTSDPASLNRRSRGRPTIDDTCERDRIVEAVSWEIFSTQGYARATIDEISRRAGVAKRTIYAHYGGKLGLLERVIRPMLRPIVSSESFESCDSAEKALSAAIYANLLTDDGERSSTIMRILISEGTTLPDLMNDVQSHTREALIESYSALFSVLIERRLLHTAMLPIRLAELFVDTVVGAIVIAQLSGASRTNATLVEDAISIFVRGCTTDARDTGAKPLC